MKTETEMINELQNIGVEIILIPKVVIKLEDRIELVDLEDYYNKTFPQ